MSKRKAASSAASRRGGRPGLGALALLAITWTGAPGDARADAIVLKNGEVLEGSIIDATRNTVVVRRSIGGMRQMWIRDIDEVRIDLAPGEQIVGQFLSWADGVYQLSSGDDLVWISEGNIVSRQAGAVAAGPPPQRLPARPLGTQTVRMAAAPAASAPQEAAAARAAPAREPTVAPTDQGLSPAADEQQSRAVAATQRPPAREQQDLARADVKTRAAGEKPGAAVGGRQSPAAGEERSLAAVAEEQSPAVGQEQDRVVAAKQPPAGGEQQSLARDAMKTRSAGKQPGVAGGEKQSPARVADQPPAAGAERSRAAKETERPATGGEQKLAAVEEKQPPAAGEERSLAEERESPATGGEQKVAAVAKDQGPAAGERQGLAVKASVEPTAPGADQMVFRIELSRPAEQTIVLIYGTVEGTAKAGKDFEPQQGMVTLAPGTRSTEVHVPLIEHPPSPGEKRFELFLTADPKVAEVVDRRVVATIDGGN
jgi:Calx-beta domain